jgi:hypothetical protein
VSLDADEHRLPVHRDARLQLCAPRSTVAMSSIRTTAVGRLHGHPLELRDVEEPGLGIDIGDEETFRLPRCRLVVVGADRDRDIGGGNAARCHARGRASRIAKVWPPRTSAEATPSTVDSNGCTTRVR